MQEPDQRREVRFLVFSASLREEALNTRLAELASFCIEAHGGIVERARMGEFDCPSYDLDVQTGEGFPAGAQAFNERLRECDGFVIAAPEHNASIPRPLKNALPRAPPPDPQPFT